MNVVDMMRSMDPQFTKTEKKIAEYMLAHPEVVARDDAAVVAKQSGFSPSSLTRFVQKLGFSNYRQYQFQYQRDYTSGDEARKMDMPAFYCEVFREMDRRFPKEEMRKICSWLEKADRVFITGYHVSRVPATHLNMMLQVMRYTTSLVPNDEAFKLDAFARRNDLVVIISAHSGVYKDVVKALEKMGDERPRILLISLDPKHPLKTKADYFVVLPDGTAIGSSHYAEYALVYEYFFTKLMKELEAKA